MKSQASIAGFTTSGQLLLACLLSLATATPPAKAYTIYSGLDPNLSGNNTPMTGNVPNSDAARDAFFARLNGVGTETFQSFTGSAGGSLPPSPFTIDFNSVDALIVDEGNSARIYNAPDNNGAYAISSTNYVRFSIPQGGSGTSFYIDLTNPAGAFGFYTTDLNNTSRLDLEISNAGGVISTLTAFPSTSLALRPSGSTTYFGFLADSSAEEFTRVRFLVSGSNDVIGFDNFSVGTLAQVEPAPGPLPLLGAAAAFGWSRRLRRRCRDRSPDPSTD